MSSCLKVYFIFLIFFLSPIFCLMDFKCSSLNVMWLNVRGIKGRHAEERDVSADLKKHILVSQIQSSGNTPW